MDMDKKQTALWQRFTQTGQVSDYLRYHESTRREQENGRRRIEKHICSANASHLWLSASLAVWVSQLESAVGIHFRRGKQHVSRHFYADGTYCLYIQESRQNPDFDDRVSTFSTP